MQRRQFLATSLVSATFAAAGDVAAQALSADPRYGFEEVVSNITNLVLSPLAASRI